MKVFIITGEINHGKTQYLSNLVNSLQEKNIKSGGFTSKGILNEKGNKDFEIVNLSDKRSMHLASRDYKPGYVKMNESFFFNPMAIDYGTSILEKILQYKSEVVIIDEIGPIELEGKVWFTPLSRVLKSSPPILLLSVRKGLTNEVIKKFDLKDPVLIHITEISSTEAAGMILKELL